MPLTGARELCVGMGTTSRSSHVGVVALSARPDTWFFVSSPCEPCAWDHVHAKDVYQSNFLILSDRTGLLYLNGSLFATRLRALDSLNHSKYPLSRETRSHARSRYGLTPFFRVQTDT